jgi:hypothetical protein
LDLINARKMENIKNNVLYLATRFSCKLHIVYRSESIMKFQKMGIFKSSGERMGRGEEPTPGISKFFVIMGHMFRNPNMCRPHQLFKDKVSERGFFIGRLGPISALVHVCWIIR